MCASPQAIRRIMIEAAEQNMTNGDYVFFNIDLFSRYFYSLLYAHFSRVATTQLQLLTSVNVTSAIYETPRTHMKITKTPVTGKSTWATIE